MTDKTLDEHAAAVERRNDVPLDRAYADILAAYEAERAARVAAEARVRELEAERAEAVRLGLIPDHPLTFGPGDNNVGRACLCGVPIPAGCRHVHAAWCRGAARTRVRKLEAERDRARAYAEERNDEANVQRALNAAAAERDETRAQLARLREAAERVVSEFMGYPASKSGFDAFEVLRRALSTPGPTLAEIRRAAQVEVLRDAAKEMAPPASPTMGSATWDAWRERIARQFGTFDAVAIHDWLRQRADDLEAGRE